MGVDPGPLPFPTGRLDPLDGFAAYRGRLNLISEHYYASLAFEALFGLVIAATVVIGTIVWLIVLAFKECCCRKPLDPMQEIANEQVKLELRKRNLWPKLFLFLFVAAACAGGACVWVGGHRLRGTADTFLDKGVNTVDSLINQVMNVTSALTTASTSIAVDKTQIEDAQETIDNAKKQLNRVIDIAKNAVEQFSIATTAYGAGVIGFALFGLFFSLLHVTHLIGLTNFFVWWLTVIGWILTGVTFISYVFSRDLCAAKRSIDRTGGVRQILPCISPAAGARALNTTYGAVYSAVEDANLAIFRAYSAAGGSSNALSRTYMCNPVARNGSTYVRNTGPCPYNGTLEGAGTVFRGARIWDFNQTYRSLRCPINSELGCYPQNQIPSAAFDAQASSASAANVFVVVAPLAEDLLMCAFVERAFNDLGGFLCSNVEMDTTIFFGGFFLYSLAFFPVFVIMVLGRNRFRPGCCEPGRGQVDADTAGGGGVMVGVVPAPDYYPGDPEKGGQGQQQLGQYAANHGY